MSPRRMRSCTGEVWRGLRGIVCFSFLYFIGVVGDEPVAQLAE